MEERNPLGQLNANTLFSSSSSRNVTGSSSSSTTAAPRKLAPIFTRNYSKTKRVPVRDLIQPASPTSRELRQEEHGRKRARVEPSSSADTVDMEMDIDTDADTDPSMEEVRSRPHQRTSSMREYFVAVPPRGEVCVDMKDQESVVHKPLSHQHDVGAWTRRTRIGGGLGRRMLMKHSHTRKSDTLLIGKRTLIAALALTTPYLETLYTRLDEMPGLPPSRIYVPSLHSWNAPRDFAPPLAIRFSNSAKLYSASSAAMDGRRRLLAVAAEEGGVRVVDVDETPEQQSDSKGWFWRAHGNAVLDVEWAADDSRIVSEKKPILGCRNAKDQLTASGDGTARVHSLGDSTPQLTAILKGHEASLKSATYADPNGGGVDPSMSSSVIATAGRDGHIMIYDVRTRGGCGANDLYGSRNSSRSRYSDGVPGFAPQQGGEEILPVMVIRHAHSPQGKKQARSVSSLIALRNMPGILASAPAHEG